MHVIYFKTLLHKLTIHTQDKDVLFRNRNH